MQGKLVAYFSATGKTKKEAEKLAKKLGADLYEIRCVSDLWKEDLDWHNPNSSVSKHMRSETFRPGLYDYRVSPAPYEDVYLGFPIWWNAAPTIINSFLEEYYVYGKIIKLFATSEYGKFGDTVKRLQPSARFNRFVEWMMNGELLPEKPIEPFDAYEQWAIDSHFGRF